MAKTKDCPRCAERDRKFMEAVQEAHNLVRDLLKDLRGNK